jgi:protein arginine kinase activator
MLCQSCGQKESCVHITKIINGNKIEMHLCEDCAKQKHDFNISSPMNFGVPLSIQNILDGFFETFPGSPKTLNNEVRCTVCEKSLSEFRRHGNLGCGNCYNTFKESMMPLIRRIHGNIEHTGKVPKRTGGVLKIKREVDKLKEDLKSLVSNEEYEKAAKLRDEIKELESKLKDFGK